VTDHRINLTLYKIDRIMDGELDEIINALSAEQQAEQLAQLAEEAGLTVADALQQAPPSTRREARLLLAAATGFSEASVVAYPERELPTEAQSRFQDFIQRRRGGEPVAYILGRKEFYGARARGQPRRSSSQGRRPSCWWISPCSGRSPPWSISAPAAVPLRSRSSGSGRRPAVVAVEASAAALVVAQRNAVKHGLGDRIPARDAGSSRWRASAST
jgi:hypothetical protein